MNDKYEQSLIDTASSLDAAMQSNGELKQCILSIIQNSDTAATVKLCRILTKAAQLKDKRILELAISVKDCLIQYYGYKQLLGICGSPRNTEDEKELSLDELLNELNKLVGLKKVKIQINDLIAFQKVQQLRKSRGL